MAAVLSTPIAQARSIDDLPEWRTGDPVLGVTRAIRADPLGALIAPYRLYGSIFRARYLNKPVVVIAGLEANEFSWTTKALWDWHASGTVFREQFGDQYLTQLDGLAHTVKRKRLSPAFRQRALQVQSPGMSAVWREAIFDHAGVSFDLRRLCKQLVVQMSGRVLLRMQLPPGADDDISILEHDLLFGIGLGPARHVWFKRPSYVRRKAAFEGLVASVVRERLADSSGDDLLSVVLRDWPDGTPLPSVEELVSDMVLLLQAGSESTAHQILWTLLLCLSRPDWLASLREELADWTPEAADSFATFPRLRATVLESERLRPAIPMALRVLASDTEVAGVSLPKGTRVLHATTMTHFLDEIYPQPQAFRPERFLGGGECPHRAHGVYGGGAHICLGMPLARVEVPVAVATVFKHADVVLDRPVSMKARFAGAVSPIEASIPARFVPR